MCVDVIATIYVWVSNNFQSHIKPLFFHIIALTMYGFLEQVQFDVMHPVMLKTFFLFFALIHRYIYEENPNHK
ncbi:hypothetical protein [Helicobacter typhlonius]